MSELRLRMRAVLTEALRARDKASASALRSALAALENAEAVPAVSPDGAAGSAHVAGAYVGVGTAEAERRRLTSAEETAIVDGELAGLAEAVATYDRLSDSDRAAAPRIGRAALAPFGSNPSSA